MRLTLKIEDVEELLRLAKDKNPQLFKSLEEQLKKHLNKDISKKQSSVKLATKKREDAAKEKILNAINLLRIENKSITIYSISKVSKCSYNTVKKYYAKES